MGYCHCRSCCSWSDGPVNTFSLWKSEAVKITSAAKHWVTYQQSELSGWQFFGKCGGHLMTQHPTVGLVDVFAATIPARVFSPGVHINREETVLPIRDGLPMTKNFSRRVRRVGRDHRRVGASDPLQFGGADDLTPSSTRFGDDVGMT